MITQEYLQSILDYNPKTGEFTWKIRKGARALIGSKAGTLDNTGYIHIAIDKKVYQAHRLAWLYVTGSFPKEFLDHINNIKTDNRIVNLRECTRQENGLNRSKQKNNTSGYKGVYFHNQSKSYRARISYKGVRHHLGNHKTAEDAYNSYLKSSKDLAKEFHFDS